MSWQVDFRSWDEWGVQPVTSTVSSSAQSQYSTTDADFSSSWSTSHAGEETETETETYWSKYRNGWTAEYGQDWTTRPGSLVGGSYVNAPQLAAVIGWGELSSDESEYATPEGSLLSEGAADPVVQTHRFRQSSAAEAKAKSWIWSQPAEATRQKHHAASRQQRAVKAAMVSDRSQKAVLPEGGYRTLEDGRIDCIPCKKTYANMSGYAKHLQEAAAHGGLRGLRDKRELPPRLTRCSDPAEPQKDDASSKVPTTMMPLALVASAASSLASDKTSLASDRTSGSSRPTGRLCVPCNLPFPATAELQRHYATARSAHPHYCPDCVTDFPDQDTLQAHYEKQNYCRPCPPVAQLHTVPSAASHGSSAKNASEAGQAPSASVSLPNQAGGKKPKRPKIDKRIPRCPLCRSLMIEAGEIASTFCGHLFCIDCISDHLAVHDDCPKCHKAITMQMLIPLYFS